MKKILDKYFNHPVKYDYGIGILFALTISLLNEKYHFIDNKALNFANLLDTISDLVTISLTFAGFILTLLTIMVTFKSTSNTTKSSSIESTSVFNLFFASDFYKKTTDYLKDSIKSLCTLSVIGFLLKLLANETHKEIILYYNIFGIAILLFTIFRNLIILSEIIKLQNENNHNT